MIATAALGVLALAALIVIARTPLASTQDQKPRESSVKAEASSAPASEEVLTDNQLQARADTLLAAVNPELRENHYFSDYAKDKLRWMMRQHAARRLTVAFLEDPDSIKLPSNVLMAASQLDGQPTIFIVKPRFAAFLRERTRGAASIGPQQKNDFALALVHEIVHLQNPAANPRDPSAFVREESRAWREVTLQMVRPLQARNQPMHQRFLDVDAALRICADQLPCPPLARLVRLVR